MAHIGLSSNVAGTGASLGKAVGKWAPQWGDASAQNVPFACACCFLLLMLLFISQGTVRAITQCLIIPSPAGAGGARSELPVPRETELKANDLAVVLEGKRDLPDRVGVV